jgi:hypothetical protein
MEHSRNVLAAFQLFAIPTVERVLGGYVDIVPVHSLDHTRAQLLA